MVRELDSIASSFKTTKLKTLQDRHFDAGQTEFWSILPTVTGPCTALKEM